MSKVWKNLLMIILIVACLFNIVIKLVKRYPLKEELKASAQYILEQTQQNDKK